MGNQENPEFKNVTGREQMELNEKELEVRRLGFKEGDIVAFGKGEREEADWRIRGWVKEDPDVAILDKHGTGATHTMPANRLIPQTPETLYRFLQALGSVKGSRRNYSAEEVATEVMVFLAGKEASNIITRGRDDPRVGFDIRKLAESFKEKQDKEEGRHG